MFLDLKVEKAQGFLTHKQFMEYWNIAASGLHDFQSNPELVFPHAFQKQAIYDELAFIVSKPMAYPTHTQNSQDRLGYTAILTRIKCLLNVNELKVCV